MVSHVDEGGKNVPVSPAAAVFAWGHSDRCGQTEERAGALEAFLQGEKIHTRNETRELCREHESVNTGHLPGVLETVGGGPRGTWAGAHSNKTKANESFSG